MESRRIAVAVIAAATLGFGINKEASTIILLAADSGRTSRGDREFEVRTDLRARLFFHRRRLIVTFHEITPVNRRNRSHAEVAFTRQQLSKGRQDS